MNEQEFNDSGKRRRDMGCVSYFLIGQGAAGRKPKPTPRSPQMPLGKQPQARNHRLERLPRRNQLTKKLGCSRFPEGLGAVGCEGYGMRKSCRRVQPRRAGMGVPHAAPRQIAKRMKIPNAAIVTRTPATHTPIIHRMRLISRCAMSVRSFSKAPWFLAMSVRSLSKAVSFFRHIGAEPFEGGVLLGHIGAEPVQSAFILRLMCVHLFPRPRQFLGNLMDRRLAHCPVPVARSSSGAHRAGRRNAEPFGANGRFTCPHPISLSAGRPSVRSKPAENIFWSINWGIPFLSVGRLRREKPAIRESRAKASLRGGIRRRAERRPAFDLPHLLNPNKMGCTQR